MIAFGNLFFNYLRRCTYALSLQEKISMEEETDNTNVEELEDVSVSSTDEQDLEDLSQEELIALVQQKEDARKKAIEHLREQQKKRKETPKTQELEEDEDEDLSDVKSIVRQELKKERVESFSQKSDKWLEEQEFAKDLFQGSEQADRLYARVKIYAEQLAETEAVTSSEEYQQMLRRAHAAITGKPDALLTKTSAEREIFTDKSQSSGYRGGSVPAKQSPNYKGFSSDELALIERTNARRAKRGLDPLKPGEILKK